MLAVILAVLVAFSSTLVMLITKGQQEETPVLKEANLQEDGQLIASTDVKGKAYFGLGILNPIEHRIIAITNSKENNANATFTTATANSITNNNDKNLILLLPQLLPIVLQIIMTRTMLMPIIAILTRGKKTRRITRLLSIPIQIFL